MGPYEDTLRRETQRLDRGTGQSRDAASGTAGGLRLPRRTRQGIYIPPPSPAAPSGGPWTGPAGATYPYLVTGPGVFPGYYTVYNRSPGGGAVGASLQGTALYSNNEQPNFADLPAQYSNAILGFDRANNTIYAAPVSVSPNRALVGTVYSTAVGAAIAPGSTWPTNCFIGAPYLWSLSQTTLYRIYFDGKSNPVVTTFTIPDAGYTECFLSPDYKWLYVPNLNKAGVDIYDVSTGIPSYTGSWKGPQAYSGWFAAQSQEYLAFGGGNSVDLWLPNGDSVTLSDSISRGGGPSPGFSPDSKFLYMGDSTNPTLDYVPITNGKFGSLVTTSISAGQVMVPTGNFFAYSGGTSSAGGLSIAYINPISATVSIVATFGSNTISMVWVI